MVVGDVLVAFFMIESKFRWGDNEQAEAEEKLGDCRRSKLMTAAYQGSGCTVRLIYKYIPLR